MPLYCPQAGYDFVEMFDEIVRQYDDSGQLSLLTSFKESPDSALSQIKLRDINIIFGFFGARNARKVLCRVSIYNIMYIRHRQCTVTTIVQTSRTPSQ